MNSISLFYFSEKKLNMKYFAVFALLVIAVAVVVSADNGEDHPDHCKVRPLAEARCGESHSCFVCLAGECYGHALKNNCELLTACVNDSDCS